MTRPEELLPALTSIVSGSIRFEICNGRDDDCDGEIDAGRAGQRCDDGNLGLCRGTGAIECRADGSGTACVITRPGEAPADEVCNDIDDDCDGQIDEGLICTGSCEPQQEVCNGVDDDCDGLIDDEDPLLGTTCGEDEGACEEGVWRCLRGGVICFGGRGPEPRRLQRHRRRLRRRNRRGLRVPLSDEDAICIEGECACPAPLASSHVLRESVRSGLLRLGPLL